MQRLNEMNTLPALTGSIPGLYKLVWIGCYYEPYGSFHKSCPLYKAQSKHLNIWNREAYMQGSCWGSFWCSSVGYSLIWWPRPPQYAHPLTPLDFASSSGLNDDYWNLFTNLIRFPSIYRGPSTKRCIRCYKHLWEFILYSESRHHRSTPSDLIDCPISISEDSITIWQGSISDKSLNLDAQESL
jgi:hypothetical protein